MVNSADLNSSNSSVDTSNAIIADSSADRLIANSSADRHTKDSHQSSKPCQPHSGKQWDGTDIFKNELCDAERFLEDLGFAGIVDPAIPERFVPSLLHHIATMPRTALWYLNHRILHTLILHKRKEQRRRLFRYSSVNNKELIESRSQIRNLLHHHVAEGGSGKEAGLVRSLTGPADCSEKDVLSACQSACRCQNLLPRANSVEITNTLYLPASNISCPISIYIEPPDDNPSEAEDAFDDSAETDTVDKGVDNSAGAVTFAQEASLDSKSVQESIIFPAANCPQIILDRSYSKFSKDRRRMVLQRCPAIRRRSASEPIIFQSQIGFGCFPRKHVDLHISDKKPLKDALLPFSYNTLHNNISFLWFKEYSMRHDNNVYINMWKNRTMSSDNSPVEILIKNAAGKPSFTRQNSIESKPCSPKNLPTATFTLSFKGNSSRNCTIKSPFRKLKDAFMPNTTDFKLIVTAQESQNCSMTNQLHLVNRLTMSDLESLLSQCFSSLPKDNTQFYHHVTKTSSYRDEKTSKKNKSLLAYHFLNHFGESKRGTISRYLSLCQGKIDNGQFVCSLGRTLDDSSVVFEQFDTPPVLLITAMAENLRSKSDSCLTFSSGFNIDIRPDVSSQPCFRSAVFLQFGHNKQLQDESLRKDRNEKEKKSHIIEYKEPPSHNFFRKATKELIELQEFIQRAKINRESASSELRILQGMLLEPKNEPNSATSSHSDRELNAAVEEQLPKLKDTIPNYNGKQIPEDDATKMSLPIHPKDARANVTSQAEREKKLLLRQLRKNILRVEQRHTEDITRMEKALQLVHSETSEDSRRSWDRADALQLMILQLQNEMLRFQQALSELQRKARLREESVSAHVEKEIRSKIQLELEQECDSRVSKMEAKLKAVEQQLRVLQEENEELRRQLLSESKPNSNIRQRTNNHQKSNLSLVNGFTPNGDITCHHIEEKRVNEEKLREELRETEERADRLNIMLDEKVVELNKLQLSLSKRTKEMVLVERAYVQMICHLYKNNNSLRSASNLPTPMLSKDKEDPP